MKKFTALFLVCIMLFSAFPALGASAASVSKEQSAIVTTFPYEIGELKDGYKLYHNGIEPCDWEVFFDIVYGKYIFTTTNGNEEGLGLFVAKDKDSDRMLLSEAIERGITDIDTAVALIKSTKDIGFPFCITSIDDAYAALEERYNGRKFNLVDLGCIYSAYRLYYNIPEEICCWTLKFEYGGYTFTEYGGQVGSYIPEDLGLYVVGNGKVYNLEEVDNTPLLNIEKIVQLINAQDIDYTFTVEKTPKTTDPTNPTEIVPTNTESATSGTDSCIPEESTTPSIKKTDREALVERTKKPEENYPIYELGEVIAGYKLYYQLNYNPSFGQKFEVRFGQYVFTQNISEYEEALGLYIVGSGTVYNLSDAFCVYMTNIDKIVELVRLNNNVPFHFSLSENGVSDSDVTVPSEPLVTEPSEQPETTTPSEPAETTPSEPKETAPSAPKETVPQKPDNTPLGKYKQFLAKNWKGKNPDDFEVDVFKKLKSGLYLVHYVQDVSNSAMYYNHIDKYLYISPGSAAQVSIFDSNKVKTYALAKAYKKGIITKKHLKTISKNLDKVDNVAKLKEYIVVLKPGETYPDFELRANSKGTKVKISNPKIVKLVKDKDGKKRLVANKKGTTRITVKHKNGKPTSFKVIVKKDPALTNMKGNTIKSVTVKEGGKVKLQIVGKVKGIDNIYRDTKYAKITSKKTAKTLTIKGLKKGKTNLIIYVNGKSLSLKVKVK